MKKKAQSVKHYNEKNTETGSNAVTINHHSGLAIFTKRLNPGEQGNFCISSDRWGVGDKRKFMPELQYFFEGAGQPGILSYDVDDTGCLIIKIKNHDPDYATDNDLIVKFGRG